MSAKAFSDVLEQEKLLYNFELPLSSTVILLLNTVTSAMENSSLQYQFAATPHITRTLPLCLLTLVNKGRPWQDGQIQLLPYPAENTLTINDLAADGHCFAGEKCIDQGNWLIIHTGEFAV
jgi:hypothetical protein